MTACKHGVSMALGMATVLCWLGLTRKIQSRSRPSSLGQSLEMICDITKCKVPL